MYNPSHINAFNLSKTIYIFLTLVFLLRLIDLPQILVPHVKLGFGHFLFLNSGTPLALEDGNSKNCAV